MPEHSFAVDPGGVVGEHSEGRFDFGTGVVGVHPQGHRQRPGQRMQGVIGALGQQQQQLAQLLAPGCGLPEQRQSLSQRTPRTAGAEQLHGEHQPLAPLTLGEGQRIGRSGGSQGGGGGTQPIGIIEMEQPSGDRTLEALLLRMGRLNQPAQLAPQRGEAGAANPVEVGWLHSESSEPIGQATGWADLAFCGEGSQLRQQLGPARGQALAQVGEHRLAGDAIEHKPATERQEGKPLLQLLLQLPPTAAQQGAIAQIKAKTAVLLANEIEHSEAALAGFGGKTQAPAQLLQKHHGAFGGPQQQHGVD